MKIIGGAVFGCLAAAVLACAGSGLAPAPAERERHTEIGPFGVAETDPPTEELSQHVGLDTSGVGWVTGFRAEVAENAGQATAPARLAHAVAALNNGTHLFVVTGACPEIRFPTGYGLPLHEILSDVGEAARNVVLTGTLRSPGPPGAARTARIRTTLNYVAPEAGDAPPGIRRLYPLRLPISRDLAADTVEHWTLPPGEQELRLRYSYLVPSDATVHLGVAYLGDYGRHMKLTDLTTGETLWQANVEPDTNNPSGRIAPYVSGAGFPLRREHEYEVSALYENTSAEAIDATAVFYLFYYLPHREKLLYVLPPADDPDMSAP